jgi:hypothetical protein
LDKLRILNFKIISTKYLNTVHLRRKCWSVVNFIVALSTRVAPNFSSEIWQPFFENAGTRPGQK